MQQLITLYNNYDEENRLNYDRARNLEFLITTRVIDLYLKEGDRILDLGSGPGKYSLFYNTKGYSVHATDIVPSHISKLQNIINENNLKKISCSVNNATDLSCFDSNSFDVIFLFGPYYHLRLSIDRKNCLNECTRVLKPNGIIAIAYLNLQFAIYYLAKHRKFLSKEIIAEISQPDVNTSVEIDAFLDISYLTTPSNIEKEIVSSGKLKILDHVGADGINPLISNELNLMTDDQWLDWCENHYRSCRESTILGLSSHGLIICQNM